MPNRDTGMLRSSPGPSTRVPRDTTNAGQSANESQRDGNSSRAARRQRRRRKLLGSLDLVKAKKLEMIELQKRLLLFKIKKELRHMMEEHAKKMELIDLKIMAQKKSTAIRTNTTEHS